MGGIQYMEIMILGFIILLGLFLWGLFKVIKGVDSITKSLEKIDESHKNKTMHPENHSDATVQSSVSNQVSTVKMSDTQNRISLSSAEIKNIQNDELEKYGLKQNTIDNNLTNKTVTAKQKLSPPSNTDIVKIQNGIYETKIKLGS